MNKHLYKQLVSRRTLVILSIKSFLLSVLAFRLTFLQIISGSKYKTLSDRNRINLLFLQPLRGKIFDSAGRPLATNLPCFRLLMDLSSLKRDKSPYIKDIKVLREVLSLPDKQTEQMINSIKKCRFNMPLTIMDNLTWQQVAIIESCAGRLHFTMIEKGLNRQYSMLSYGGSLIGYLGMVNKSEKKSIDKIEDPNIKIGKSGIEKQYNDLLIGRFGYRRMEINAHSRFIREVENQPSMPGDDITISVDSDLQNNVASFIKPVSCSALAMDCKTGDVLLNISKPDFDPGKFVSTSKSYWQEINDNSLKPLINRNIQTSWPVGSIFKIITFLAALEAGIDPNTKFFCGKKAKFSKRKFNCWKEEGHGSVDMAAAVQGSCNTYTFQIARMIGHERIIDMARRFGFGKITGIDLPFEAAGFVPDEKWKKRALGSSWHPGDTLNLAIGQGFLLGTNIQIARAMAAISNGGIMPTPRILMASSDKSINPKTASQKVDVNPDHLAMMRKWMISVVNDVGGTAFAWSRDASYNLAGKTGTAQVSSKRDSSENLSSSDTLWARRNHGIFGGFAPFDDPRYAISVFVEHGGSGGRVAAPIARKIASELRKREGRVKI